MSENLPNIDDLFRKGLDEYEDIPSGNVWADIEKNLDKKKVVFISKKYKKLKWTAAALLIFSAGMAMYTWNTRIKNKELVKQNEINKNKALSTPGSFGGNNESDTSGKIPADKSLERKTIHEQAEAKDAASSKADKAVIAETERQNTNKVTGVPVAGVKTATGKTEKDAVAVNKKTSIIEKSAVETEKQLIENKLKDEPASDVAKRNVETASVYDHDKNLPIAESPSIEAGRSPEIRNKNNKETIANKTFAAENAIVKPFRNSRFSATIFYSPDFVSARVRNDRHTFREDDRNEIKNKEKISHSSHKGVLISYNAGNNWNIQSGLTFSTVTTDIRPKTIFARPDNRGNINYRINCSAGYSYVTLRSGNRPASGDSVRALSAKNTLQYFSIPFVLTYNLPAGRFSLQPGAGVAANFLSKGSIETVIETTGGNEKSSIDRIEGLNSSYLNGSVSLAANYNFTKNLALNFTPVARFALSAINKDAPVKTYLNSLGLAAGLTISF